MAKTYKEVRRALLRNGWRKVRQAGSHEIWERGTPRETITVAGKDSATVPVGTLAAIRRKTGLEELR